MTTVPVTITMFLLPLVRHFRTKGWKVDAISGRPSENRIWKEEFDRTFEIQWSRNPFNPINLLGAPNKMRKIVGDGNYDIVHIHTPVAGFVTRFALRSLRKNQKPKIIYTAHGFHFHGLGSFLGNNFFLGMEKIAGYWTDFLVVINREDETAAKRHRIVDTEKVVYMPGIGIDTEYFAPESVSAEAVTSIRRELNLSPETSLFLMIAEFNLGKRHKDALEAFARLNTKNALLVFAGTGPLMNKMRRYANKLGIGETVSFLGWRNDIRSLIRSSVCTLLPSEREGLPRSIMESLSLEVPVIGADVRGIKELIVEGCGILVKVGDVRGISKAMAWLLNHPEKAKAMGKQGRLSMVKRYGLGHIIHLHEKLYSRGIKMN